MGDLRLTRENVDFMIRVQARDVDLGTRDADEGKKLTTLAVLHRWRGIARHLASGAAHPFASDLARAVQARRTHLQRLEAGTAAISRYGSLEQNRALFDAVAIGDQDGTTSLARLGMLARPPRPQLETDEWLLEYLHGLLAEWPPDPTAGVAAGRTTAAIAALAAADPSPAHDLVQAIEARDGRALSTALLALVEQRQARFAADLTLPPELLATERHIWVLGIALVNVAHAIGIATADEYPTIPGPLLGLSTPQPLAPESWRTPS